MRQLTQYTSSPLSAPWADRLGAEARQVSVHGQQHARPTAHPHESPTYHGLRQRRVRHDERTGSDAPDQQRQRQQQEHNSRVCCTVGDSKGGLPCRREAGSTVSCESPTAVESSLVSGSPPRPVGRTRRTLKAQRRGCGCMAGLARPPCRSHWPPPLSVSVQEARRAGGLIQSRLGLVVSAGL